ncbi:MAG TPA: hypothetical protein VGN35_10200 [Jatrophihabitantaceae bacterium]|nr:hypothetical protein [Jatrophihabitantaceae bacterium]
MANRLVAASQLTLWQPAVPTGRIVAHEKPVGTDSTLHRFHAPSDQRAPEPLVLHHWCTMDEAELRRLLALAADDSDRPPAPASWPQAVRAEQRRAAQRRAEKRRDLFIGLVAAGLLINRVRRRHRATPGDR